MASSADRNLLIGIMALQMDFITRDQLVAAMNAWVLAKQRPLGEILVEQKALSHAKWQLLEPLVEQHVKDHSDNPQHSLAALSSISSIRSLLGTIPDADVQASIGAVRPPDQLSPTSTPPTLDYSESTQRYRILRPHARGGLGEVFVAEDAELHREVALKEIQRDKDRQENRARFLLEAEITGGLEHPGIVPVYGLGHYEDGRPYYAMRFIKGDNLAEAIKRFHANTPAMPSNDFDSLEFRRLLQRFIDVCEAVAYAHSRGVLHRDLKPGNIMLGKYGETLVVDWGLAKAAGRSVDVGGLIADPEATLKPASGSDVSPTAYGAAIGTPAYMSPEQAEGRLDKLGPASDVYSLGATLYHLLVGKPRNHDCDAIDAVVRAQIGEFVRPRSLNPHIPKSLEAICLKAMALKPADRYATAQELAAEIEHWLADEPVEAWRESLTIRTRRWVRKHPGTVAALAASLVVGVLGLGSGLYFVNAERGRTELARQDEQRQRKEAQEQRLKADLQRDRAEEEKRIALSVRDFLQNKLLGLADTRNQADALLAVGRESGETELDPRISVLLDRAAAELTPEKIESQFPNQPLVQAEILHTLGNTYRGIGKYAAAIAHLSRARDLRITKLGADHPDTVFKQNDLALAFSNAGKIPEAIQILKQVSDAQFAKFGADHPRTLGTLNNLALAYKISGKFPEALQLFKKLSDAQVARLGANHPLALATLDNLAGAYYDLHKPDEAVPIFERVLDARIAKLGADHPSTLLTLNNLASAYEACGKLAEATRLFEQVRDARVAKLGAEHPDTLSTLNNLATAYYHAGRLGEAARLYKQVSDVQVARLGADHPDTLNTLYNLASVYYASRKLAEATRLFEQVRDARVAKLGADHPDTLRTLCNLALAYERSGKRAEAIQLFEQVRDAQVAKLGADHPDTLRTLNNLALAHQRSGKLAEAIRLLEQVRDAEVVKLGADHPSTLTTLNNLALAYQTSGVLAEAARMFEEAASGIEKRNYQHEHAVRIVPNTIACYEQMKDFEKAESWRRKWLAHLKNKSGPESPTYATELAGLGGNLIQQKKYAEAEAILRECLTVRAKKEADAWPTFFAKSLLGSALAGQKKFEEAEPLLMHGYEGVKARQDKIPAAIKQKRLQEALNRLIELYDTWGKPEKAAKWRAELENVKKPATPNPADQPSEKKP